MHFRTTVVCLVWAAALLSSPDGQVDGDYLLVSLSGDDRVVAVRPATGAVMASYPTGDGPHEITLSADRTRALVANSGAPSGEVRPGLLSVLDLPARTTRPPLDLGRFTQPHDVRMNRDGTLAWAAVAPSQGVVEIGLAQPDAVRFWDTGAEGGWFVEVTPDARKIYVPHLEGRRVTVIDRTTGNSRTVYEGGAQSGIAMRPESREVWVVAHEARRVNVIDTETDTVVGFVSLASAAFGRIAFTPDGRHLALVQGRRLGWIDASARRELASVEMPLAGKVPAVSPDGRRLAMSNPADDRVTIVELPSLRLVASHPVGQTPDGVVWVR